MSVQLIDKKDMPPQWLQVQRIGLYGYILAGILLLIYSLGFLTNEYIFYAYGDKDLGAFYQEMQWVNKEFLWKVLVVIVFGVLLCALEMRNHAAGLWTLLITIAFLAASISFAVISISDLLVVKDDYLSLDLSSLNRYIERGTITYTVSTLIYDMGIVLWSLLLVFSGVLGGIVVFNACKVCDSASENQEVTNETI